MSKQDTHFFNTFSVVLGLLIAFAIAMFALARYVGAHTQNEQVLKDPMFVASVATRTQRPVRVAVAGQDNSALAIVAPSTATAGFALPVPKDATEVFEQACKTCHGVGLAGAPKAGDKAAWAPRIAKGKATLHEHAIKGFTGAAGVMPAKGGRADVPDELIEQAVDYMLSL